ncbi:MAG: hypothetical protein HRT80_04365 [Henriciella sp.]|nr:hypothetical protein [Henriciella sp.]
MIKRLITAALISGLAVTSAAIADNTEYVSIITKQLDDVETRMKPVMESSDRQMLRVGEIISLTDKERNGAYYLTELEPNTNYLIVGVCDGDCGDLDLQIDDPSGTTLDTDVEDDDAPVLEFKTDADTFYYKLLVDMVTCKTDACFYGVGIFKTDAEPASNSSSDYSGVIDRQLAAIRQQVTEAANQNGREVTQIFEHRSMLTTGSEDVIALDDIKTLERYVAVAVCDQDCDALDLQIDITMVGTEPDPIAETNERTDFPMLEFVGRPFSEHSATVRMTECSSEPCFYGMVVYALSDKS